MTSPRAARAAFRGTLTPITIVVYLALFTIWKQAIYVPDCFVILRLLFLAGVAVLLLANDSHDEIRGYFIGRILPDLKIFQVIRTLAYFVSGRLAMLALNPAWIKGGHTPWDDCVVAPINEEMIFRGLFTAILLQHLPGRPALAIAISTLVFITTHHVSKSGGGFDFNYLLSLSLSGCLLGWTYWKSESGPFCMLCHSVWNMIGYILKA